MIELSFLRNTTREQKRCKIVGRGPGSGMGKTSCRGQKGDGARSGYKRRYGYEGGQLPLYEASYSWFYKRSFFEENCNNQLDAS